MAFDAAPHLYATPSPALREGERERLPVPAESARLATTSPGRKVRIVHIAQEEENAAWLRAVGMHEGAEVTVLRRAPFGGPLHLRSGDGGEFAIHRDLAHCIVVATVEGLTGNAPGRGA